MIFRKPVLITVHEVFGSLRGEIKQQGRLYRLFERLVFQFPYTTYVCVSQFTRNKLQQLYHIPDKKLFTVYNGVNTKLRNKDTVDVQLSSSFKKDISFRTSYSPFTMDIAAPPRG
ncbi:MAG: glycosyltransferase [Candidatus Peribacteria bacterium]|nr:MAG: glycosyltransferase [Candidatus Peribacteria bacterium]